MIEEEPMSTKAKQLRFYDFGGPEMLRLETIELPEPGAGDGGRWRDRQKRR